VRLEDKRKEEEEQEDHTDYQESEMQTQPRTDLEVDTVHIAEAFEGREWDREKQNSDWDQNESLSNDRDGGFAQPRGGLAYVRGGYEVRGGRGGQRSRGGRGREMRGGRGGPGGGNYRGWQRQSWDNSNPSIVEMPNNVDYANNADSARNTNSLTMNTGGWTESNSGRWADEPVTDKTTGVEEATGWDGPPADNEGGLNNKSAKGAAWSDEWKKAKW